MLSFLYIAVWVLVAVFVGMIVGYWWGRSNVPPDAKKKSSDQAASPEQEQALKLLATILDATEKLHSNVDTHNSELTEVGRELGGMELSGELQRVQNTVVTRITTVIQANKRLEDDLVCTRYQLENQAQEIDRHRREARTDSLSGVANRKAFDEFLQYLLANYNLQQEPFALVLMDIDHFKWINDTHGHPAGDLVVQNVATCLKSLVRNSDMVFRFGGDEFGLLLTKIDGQVALEAAHRLHRTVSQKAFEIGDGSERVSVTASVGLTAVRPNDVAAHIIARADAALYRSKRNGRNQVNFELEAPPVEAAPAPAAEGPEAIAAAVVPTVVPPILALGQGAATVGESLR